MGVTLGKMLRRPTVPAFFGPPDTAGKSRKQRRSLLFGQHLGPAFHHRSGEGDAAHREQKGSRTSLQPSCPATGTTPNVRFQRICGPKLKLNGVNDRLNRTGWGASLPVCKTPSTLSSGASARSTLSPILNANASCGEVGTFAPAAASIRSIAAAEGGRFLVGCGSQSVGLSADFRCLLASVAPPFGGGQMVSFSMGARIGN